jgi:hypothetical protein
MDFSSVATDLTILKQSFNIVWLLGCNIVLVVIVIGCLAQCSIWAT